MNVKNINLNCQSPRHFGKSVTTEADNGRKRYKYFEQMDDDTLMLKSVLKAHSEVEKSNKSKLFKAMPAIATGMIGTAYALTHPGKLSGKIASGVGFLVAALVADKVSDKVDNTMNHINKPSNEAPKPAKTSEAIKTVASVAGTVLALSGLAYVGTMAHAKAKNSQSGLAKALVNDGKKLVEEINTSKLGKFVSEKVAPFEAKHQTVFKAARVVAPVGTIAAFGCVQNKLANGISKDIKEKSAHNFAKGKLIQEAARKEFDKIDAEEVHIG